MSHSPNSPNSPDSPTSHPDSHPDSDSEHNPFSDSEHTPVSKVPQSSQSSQSSQSYKVRLNKAQKLIDSVVADMVTNCEGIPFGVAEKAVVKINALRRASKACVVKEAKPVKVKVVKPKTVKTSKK